MVSLGGLGIAAAFALAPLGAIAGEHDPAIATVAMLPGKVVAQSKTSRSDGDMKLRGWRLEEIKLAPTRVTVNGHPVEVTRAWRVSLIGGPFVVRALPAILWVGDRAIGVGRENANLTEISAITFDRDVLRDGATIALSWGEHGNKYTLGERLAAPAGRR
jgi:hypothetical protein